MNLKFLQLPENERKLYIDQAAIQRNVSPIVFEKDFWVCWLLGILFRSEFADHIVFKGGTSPSRRPSASGLVPRLCRPGAPPLQSSLTHFPLSF